MQGLEVALVRLATTVLGTVARSLVTPKPGAGLIPDPVRPLPARRSRTGWRRCSAADWRSRTPDSRSTSGWPPWTGVKDTFAAAGALTADRLFALNLNPERLAAELSAPPAGLSERTAGLRTLCLFQCRIPHGLAPLRDLPGLTSLVLESYSGFADLTPLRGLTDLTIALAYGTRATGTELFPPERTVHRS